MADTKVTLFLPADDSCKHHLIPDGAAGFAPWERCGKSPATGAGQSDGLCAAGERGGAGGLCQSGRAPIVGVGQEPHTRAVVTLTGKSWWELLPPLYGTAMEPVFQQAMQTQEPGEGTAFHPGWCRWLHFRAHPTPGGGLTMTLRDVTATHAATLEASRRGEHYQRLFSSIEEALCVVELIWNETGDAVDGRFLEVNEAFATQTGIASPVGKRLTEVSPQVDADLLIRYGRVARTGVPARFEQYSKALHRWFSGYAFRLQETTPEQIAILFTDTTARRQTEQEIGRLNRELEGRVAELETVLKMLPVGIGIARDPECSHIQVNPFMAKVLGLEDEANASKTAPEGERPHTFRCTDDNGQEVADHELPMQVAAREGRVVTGMELTVERSDGKRIRLLEYATPLLDEAGNPRGAVGTFVDVTERRQQEMRQAFVIRLDEAVRPLEDPDQIVATAARLLGEHLGTDRCAYAEIAEDGDTMHITGDFTRGVPSIVGTWRFSAFGEEVHRLMHEAQAYICQDVDQHHPPPGDLEAYRRARIQAVICVPLHKDGRFAAAMAVHQSTPRRWTAAEVDLTLYVAGRCWEALERARVTRDLAESHALFRRIADVMPQVVWLADPEGRVTYFNRRWFDFTGDTGGLSADTSWLHVLHPDDLERCQDTWLHSVRTGAPYEVRYRWKHHASGLYRWFLGRAVPLRDDEGKIVRWYGTSTDIDQLVHAEEAAQLANRSKDDFLAALSHELRTPLSPVLMIAEDLKEDPRLPSDVQEAFSMVQRNIELEARLIDDLLDLTRISKGKLTVNREGCDAHHLLRLALEITTSDARSKRISVDTHLAAARTRLEADPARLQQVFWNLLRNAVKFTPPGGCIRVVTLDVEDGLLVEVSDNGIGIPAPVLDRVFLPFEQGLRANDHRFGGLGLGLSISKALVEIHQGRISAHSAGEGQGSTFRVLLPSRGTPEGASPIMSPPPPVPAARPRPLHLLLVEDDASTLAVLARLLRQDGHRVEEATTVNQARQAAAAQAFDAVVSDIGLPDGSGLDLMAGLQATSGLRGVALSGYGMENDLARSRAAGFVAHLIKPVDYPQLRQALETHFGYASATSPVPAPPAGNGGN